MKTAIAIMIYLGSALMVYNIVMFYGFIKNMRNSGSLKLSKTFLYLPFFLLCFFLIGYLTTAFFANPDLMMGGILFGGSIYVYLILNAMIRIVNHIKADEKRASALYNEMRSELTSMTKDRLAVFRVNLTKDIIEDRAGSDMYETDMYAQSYTELVEYRRKDFLINYPEEKMGVFSRESLLGHFNNGHTYVSKKIFAKRKSYKTGYFLLEATFAKQPETGDVTAFITESDYNRKMVDKIIWKKALDEQYDAIAYIAGGQIGLVSHRDYGINPVLMYLGEREESYKNYVIKLTETLAFEEEEDRERALSELELQRVDKEMKDKEVYHVDLSYVSDWGIKHKRFSYFAAKDEANFYVLMISDRSEVQ